MPSAAAPGPPTTNDPIQNRTRSIAPDDARFRQPVDCASADAARRTGRCRTGPAREDDGNGTRDRACRQGAAQFRPQRHRIPAAAGSDWKISAAIAALALLLVLQLLLADRAQLAADARWRPLVSTLCRVFGCTLPPWREPSAFAVLARDVRPHPSTPGALRVTATFRNDARWPQPWPRLRLTLSDVDGNAVATRDFSARDYLGAQPTPAELASGQSASIAMDVVEPAARSVAFDFELR